MCYAGGNYMISDLRNVMLPTARVRFRSGPPLCGPWQVHCNPVLAFAPDVTSSSAELALGYFKVSSSGFGKLSAMCVLFWAWAVSGSAGGRGMLPRIEPLGVGGKPVHFMTSLEKWPGKLLRKVFEVVLGRSLAHRCIKAAETNEFIRIRDILAPGVGVNVEFQRWANGVLTGMYPTALVAIATSYGTLTEAFDAPTIRKLERMGAELMVSPWRLLQSEARLARTRLKVIRSVVEPLSAVLCGRAEEAQNLSAQRDCSSLISEATREPTFVATFQGLAPLRVSDSKTKTSVRGIGGIPGETISGPVNEIGTHLLYLYSQPRAAAPLARYLVSGAALQLVAAVHTFTADGARTVLRIEMFPHLDCAAGRALASTRTASTAAEFPWFKPGTTSFSVGCAELITYDFMAVLIARGVTDVVLYGATSAAAAGSLWTALLHGAIGAGSVVIRTEHLQNKYYVRCPDVMARPAAFAAELKAELAELYSPSPVPRADIAMYREITTSCRRTRRKHISGAAADG